MSGLTLFVTLLALGDEPARSADQGITPPVVIARPRTADEAGEPEGNSGLATIFSTSDYPDEAIRRGESGSVTVKVTVNADGSPGPCVVTGSSQSAVLDAATCNVIRSRARFKPARDRNGRAVAATTTARINWELPDGNASPADDMARLWVRFNDQGDAEACGLANRANATTYSNCDPVKQVLGVAWSLAGDQRPLTSLTLAQVIDRRPVNVPGQISPTAEDRYIVARQVIEMDLDDEGMVAACRVLVNDGARQGRQACSMMTNMQLWSQSPAKVRHVQSSFILTATPSK